MNKLTTMTKRKQIRLKTILFPKNNFETFSEYKFVLII